MAKKDIHVVPHKDEWATKKEGAGRAGAVTDTQKQKNGVRDTFRNYRR